MNDINILLNQQNELEFEVDIDLSSKQITPRFVIEVDGMDLSFEGKLDNNKVMIQLPILANTIETKDYKCRLEMIADGSTIITPLKTTLTAELPIKVKSINGKELETTKPVDKSLKVERETETKSFNFEFKELSAETGEFKGYAAVFGNIDNHNDIIHKGAFTKTLKETRNVKLLWQHNIKEPIGAFTKIYVDDIGLVVEGKLAMGVKRAQEVFELMKVKALEGLSIGYKTIKSTKDASTGTRTLNEVRLMEVSVVTFPSNDKTLITDTKALEDPIEILNDLMNTLKTKNTGNESNIDHSDPSSIAHEVKSDNDHQDAINDLINNLNKGKTNE